MADHIENPIHKIEDKVKNGHFKFKRIKLKTTASKDFSDDAAKVVNDNISRMERKQICKKARKRAHLPSSDMKVDVSKEVRSDLGLANG